MSETNAPDWKCPDCGRCECSKEALSDCHDDEGYEAWLYATNVCIAVELKNLRAQLAAAREAVAEMRQDHRGDCARIILGQWGRECDCGWTEILAARRALGLEE